LYLVKASYAFLLFLNKLPVDHPLRQVAIDALADDEYAGSIDESYCYGSDPDVRAAIVSFPFTGTVEGAINLYIEGEIFDEDDDDDESEDDRFDDLDDEDDDIEDDE
jgi:hypothetical protein